MIRTRSASTCSQPVAANPERKWLFAMGISVPVLAALAGIGVLLWSEAALAADAVKSRPAKKRPAAQEKISRTTGVRLDQPALTQLIDQQVKAGLLKNEVQASGPCTDAEFIRRVYLDLIGVVPPPEKVKSFLESREPNRRARLIDELLANPRYGTYFGEIWTDAMLPKDSNNRRLQTEPLHKWLAEQFNRNQPWDKIVRELVTATGPVTENEAVTFFVANPTPDKVTDKVTQLFLGVQLQCAQCHNHPFTEVKQDEYWGMAAFFMNVNVKGNPNQAAKKGVTLTVSEVAGPYNTKRRKARLPESAKFVPAKFLDGPSPEIGKKDLSRSLLAEWMTAKDNRYFARAIANKLWHHFLGRGLVNPVDDMHDDNPASHPELLAELAEQMKASNFDLKYLIRAICNSETYQRSSRPTGNNGDDRELFSHAQVRMLSPEQLYDSLEEVLGKANEAPVGRGRKAKQQAKRKNNGNGRDQFVTFFSTDSGFDPLEYQAGIPQALRLMNSRQLNTTGAVARAMKAGGSPAEIIEHLYLSALARRPTAAETERLTEYVHAQTTPRDAYSDILWALVNSSEFTFNR